MTNRSKAKGTRAESAVVEYLRNHGFPRVERRALQGAADQGDIAGIYGWTLEVKCCTRMELAAWVDEADVEAHNAKTGWRFAVIHKRPRVTDPARWYVTLPLESFTQMLHGDLRG